MYICMSALPFETLMGSQGTVNQPSSCQQSFQKNTFAAHW